MTLLPARFDVVVLGAGINGAGIARDAASRGLKVLLVDKGDIASGTSSTSTRLIHGGLRYLEHGEFGLVKESLRERETLLRIAPHLVKPLELLVPVYQNSTRGMLKIRAGMALYDLLSRGKSCAGSRLLSRKEILNRVPGLRREELQGAALYFDAQVEHAERLVLENVIAATAYGTEVRTYCQLRNIQLRQGLIEGIEFTDLRTNESWCVQMSCVINAAGPWVDHVFEGENLDQERLIGGTKGSHIVVPRFQGAPETALYVEARSDHRPFFIIPWNAQFLIGTTDIRFEGNPDDVQITEAEIEYLLRETSHLFPAAGLTRESILFTFSGVRPLAFTREKDEQSITRRHFLRQSPTVKNLISIVGGKLTTFRKVAEEAVDLLEGVLKRSLPKSLTNRTLLPGATHLPELAETLRRKAPFGSNTTERLLNIYGSRAELIATLAASDKTLATVIDETSGGIAAEVVHAFKNEFACSLSDVLLRRTMWAFNSDRGGKAAENAARVCRDRLDWPARRAQAELASFEAEMRTKHSV